jgi:hypothetical protein
MDIYALVIGGGIIAGAVLAIIHPAQPRQGSTGGRRTRRRWLAGFGIGLPIPLPGPLYAWLSIFRIRR